MTTRRRGSGAALQLGDASDEHRPRDPARHPSHKPGLTAHAPGAERRPPPCRVTSAPGARPESRKSCPRPAAPSARIAALSCSRLCKGRASVLTDSVLCGLGQNWKQTTLQHPSLWDQSPESWGFPGVSVVKTPRHRCWGNGGWVQSLVGAIRSFMPWSTAYVTSRLFVILGPQGHVPGGSP